MTRANSRTLAVAILVLCLAPSARAGAAPGQAEPQGEAGGSEALAKKTQNPVSDLISVPFQENLTYDIGPFDRTQSVLNIQPVIPIKLGENWSLVTRTIAPIVYQPDLGAQTGGVSGLGDINPTLLLAPAKPGAVIWGIGPSVQLPTASQRALGTGKWCVGPAAVVLIQPGPFTLGAIAWNLWSFAGPSDREGVNQLTAQYFINLNFKSGWYLGTSPVITANWKAPAGQKWLVPVGLSLGKIFKLGKLPLNGQVGGYDDVVAPDPGPGWQLRLQLALLFPT